MTVVTYDLQDATLVPVAGRSRRWRVGATRATGAVVEATLDSACGGEAWFEVADDAVLAEGTVLCWAGALGSSGETLLGPPHPAGPGHFWAGLTHADIAIPPAGSRDNANDPRPEDTPREPAACSAEAETPR